MSETKSDNNIEIYGARVHNLKNVDVTLPRHSLCVITGLSGSGKSSLAFDTLYAEGQRRYIETFSAYARNFLDNLERPDVDKITGLSPVISIEQKTTSKNPRSTVGTVTEIYDFLRLLYARAAEAYSYVTGEKMVKYTEERIVDMILTAYEGHKVYLLAPLVRSRKGHYKELFETVRRKGFLTVRVDGELREATPGMRLDRYKNHDIEVVVDKLAVKAKDAERLHKSVAQTLQQGGGVMMVLDAADNQTRFFSKQLMDPASGIAYREPAPHNFSFNSAQGACPKCKGLGYVSVMDHDKVVPDDKLSIREGGLAPLGKYRNALIFWEIQSVLADYDCDLKTPICDLPPEALDEVFNGRADRLRIPAQVAHTTDDYYVEFDGLVKYIQQMADSDMGAASQRWAEQFSKTTVCPECHGARLNKEAMAYRLPANHSRTLQYGHSRAIRLPVQRRGTVRQQTPGHSTRNTQRADVAPQVPARRRTRLPVVVALLHDPLGWREPAHQVSHTDRFATRQRALHTRRAQHRPPPARQRAPYQLAQGVA